MEKVGIGRIVRYIMPDGQERPAIIVRTWNEECVQLQVFTDGENDGAVNVEWKTSVLREDVAAANMPIINGHRVGTWHWPKRT